jgi:hypothetical protein
LNKFKVLTVPDMSLANQFAAYTAWRSRLSSHVGEFQGWLNKNELSDGQTICVLPSCLSDCAKIV